MKSVLNCFLNRRTLIGIVVFITYNFFLVYTVWDKNLIYYETNDDYFMAMIYSGMLGDYSSQAIFSNTIYGWILSSLYKLFPIWNWMTVLYVVVSIFSFAILVYVFMRLEAVNGFIMAATVLTLFHIPIYCSINFTRFAMLFSIVGILLFVSSCVGERNYCKVCKGSIEKNSSSALGMVIGAGLALWGCMIRAEVFFMSLPFILCLIDYRKIFYAIKSIKEKRFNLKSRQNIVLIVIVIVFALIYCINSLTYSTSQWKQIIDENKDRVLILDFGYIPTGNIECENTTLDSKDTEFYTSWHIADRKVFSSDNLARMVKQSIDEGHAEGFFEKWQYIYKYIDDIYGKVLSNYLFVFGVIIAVVGFALSKSWSRRLNLFFAIFICLFEELYLEFLGKFVARVYIIPVFALCVISIYNLLIILRALKDDKKGKRGLKYAICIGCIIILTISIVKSNALTHKYSDRERTLNHESIISLYEQINSEDDNKLYILDDIGNDLALLAYSVYDCYDYGLLRKVAFDFGWQARIPYNYSRLSEYGSDNTPYIPLLYNENVFLLGNVGLGDRLEYLRRQYDSNAAVSLVRSIGEYNIYSYNTPIENTIEDTISTWQIDTVKKSKQDENFTTITGTINDANIDQLYFEIDGSDNKKRCYVACDESDLKSGRFICNIFSDDVMENATVRLIYSSNGEYYSTSSKMLF